MRRLGIPLESFILISIVIGEVVDSSTDYRSKETPEKFLNLESPSDTIILRKKRTIRYEDLPLSIRKRLAENLETISDYEDDLYDEDSKSSEPLSRRGREALDVDVTDTENSRVKREKSFPEENGSVKTRVNLEKAKSQLERVEKKVENEIRSLRKRGKSSKSAETEKKRQILSNNSLASHPRLLKIEVDTFEIGRESPRDTPGAVDILEKSAGDKNSGESKLEFQKEVRRQVPSSEPEEKDKVDSTRIEDQLQRQIDAVKERVKQEFEEKLKIREIETNNARYDELMRLEREEQEDEGLDDKEKRLEDLSGNSDSDLHELQDVRAPHDSIRKRSAGDDESEDEEIEEEIKFRRKGNPKTRKFRKSVLPSHRSLGVDEMSESEVQGRSEGLGEGRRLKHSRLGGRQEMRKSFLFPGRLYTRPRRENSRRKRKRGQHKHRRQSRGRGRWERAADELLNEVQSDSVADVNSPVDDANSQDLGLQMVPEYQEAFGGLPNDPSGPLTRYKRIKRTS
ncbi:trichohyalin-like isoform X2 [Fopius arisanus]|uniref:Trichohyalin-like isoform X2 n=2 Tax=Fopius arisanus TaxID=64838 RepID=A0A9R1U2K5_9HYME|nr:PREDICTED: trichohyalin-like isoform X2 [Fopius arisanus]